MTQSVTLETECASGPTSAIFKPCTTGCGGRANDLGSLTLASKEAGLFSHLKFLTQVVSMGIK